MADCGPIDTVKSPSDVRATPYPLPTGFEWSTVNVDDEEELRELYTLLTENYVEDDDNMFRFDYSAAFLKWCVPPTPQSKAPPIPHEPLHSTHACTGR